MYNPVIYSVYFLFFQVSNSIKLLIFVLFHTEIEDLNCYFQFNFCYRKISPGKNKF